MARKPNWKRIGLDKPRTVKDLQAKRKAEDMERKLLRVPESLRPMAREVAQQHPGLLP